MVSLASPLTAVIRSLVDELKNLLLNDEMLLNGDDVGIDDDDNDNADDAVGYSRSAAARTEIKDRVFNNCMVDVLHSLVKIRRLLEEVEEGS